MKFGVKYYFHPTPKKIRKWADSVLAATSLLGTSAIIQDYNVLAIIVLSIGAISKFISNFFSEENLP